jgi:ATP/maltotriose-dependent transcriptional regulator MalT/two-component SAPR family response regulator
LESSHAITKILLPGKRTGLLHRPRLVDFLHEHVDRKLLLVSAPAGYGKTSLLIDLAHETTLPVCWYSVDSTDSDPKIFLEYIVASLRRQFPDFGSRTLSVLVDPGSMNNVAAVVNTLVTEIYEEIPSYFLLVLDDYHTVEESEKINQIIDLILRLSPENAHLILSSRTLPSQLTLTRLTARQEIAGLGQNDLRFSADEIRAFVKQNYSIDLAENDALDLAVNSEGWITGILLTTQTMWRGLFQHLARTQGPHGRVFNYLASEVFEQQPPELQRLLLDSSILDQLQPSLCNDLLEITNSLDLFRALEQKNLFITRLEGDEIWYRYHHLFREFLESRLRDSDRTRWQMLHHRAAELFEARGQQDQVIRHYLEIRAFGEAALTIERASRETFDAGHWTTLAKWIDALPADELDAHTSLIVWRGNIYAETGKTSEAKEFYSHALRNFEAQNDQVGLGKTLIKQAIFLRFQGNYQESIENCRRALELLPATERESIAEAHRLMGISYGRQGDLDRDVQELKAALEIYEAVGDLRHIAMLNDDIGVANRTRGNANANEHFQIALEYWQRSNNPMGLANTLNSIGVGYHREGKYEKAIETLEKAVSQARQSGQLRVEALTLASLGDVFRDQGNYLRAQEAFENSFEIARRINEGFVITYTLNALGITQLISGDLGTADELISQALDQAKAHHSNYELGLGHTSLGILNYKKGNTNAAVEYLTRAGELLDQGGARRDSARAHLHLAHANFVQGKFEKAADQLETTADLGQRIGEDQFIVGDGTFVLPVIKYAVSKKIGNNYFADALRKIETLSKPIVIQAPELAESTPLVQAYALGTVRVVVDNKNVSRVDWSSNAAKEFFFLLLANPVGLRKEEIVDALWTDIAPAKANGMFHTTLYRVRRALLPDVLVYENGLYHINDELNMWYDVTEFSRLLSKSKNLPSEAERIDCYRQAIELYKGDFIEDSYNDWCIPIRNDLLTKYLDTLYELAKYLGSHSEYEQALDLHQKILTKDPCREEIYQAVMRIQADSGDRSGAIRTFHQCVEVLRKELRVSPSNETRMLYEQILKSKKKEKKA